MNINNLKSIDLYHLTDRGYIIVYDYSSNRAIREDMSLQVLFWLKIEEIIFLMHGKIFYNKYCNIQ